MNRRKCETGAIVPEQGVLRDWPICRKTIRQDWLSMTTTDGAALQS